MDLTRPDPEPPGALAISCDVVRERGHQLRFTTRVCGASTPLSVRMLQTYSGAEGSTLAHRTVSTSPATRLPLNSARLARPDHWVPLLAIPFPCDPLVRVLYCARGTP